MDIILFVWHSNDLKMEGNNVHIGPNLGGQLMCTFVHP